MNDRKLGPDEFRCGMCGEIFYKGQTDEEAKAQQARAGITEDVQVSLVCEDCYRFTPWGCTLPPDDDSLTPSPGTSKP